MMVLSPLFLWFGLAGVVPLILHLYQRRRRTVLLYSTNRFFTRSVVQSQRRMRIHRVLLLLLRIAACVLLACAAAQPLASFLGFGRSAGKRDVVILLDDSLSMQAPATDGASGATHFDRARTLALGLLAELGNGDRAAVVTSTGKSLGRLSTDLAGLAAQVRALTPTCAGGDEDKALDTAGEIFGTDSRRSRLLAVVSDFQASDWPAPGSWPQPAQPTDMTMVSVGPPPGDHVVPQSMVLMPSAAVVGQPDLLNVRVVNFGSGGAAAELIVDVDGREQARRALQLSGRESVVESLPISFDSAGDHGLTARVLRTPGDPLAQVGQLFSVVRVSAEIPVLLIDGQNAEVRDARRQSPAFYLRAAMLALGRGGGSSDGLSGGAHESTFHPTTIGAADLTDAIALESYRVIILANVHNLALSQVERLGRFVRAGGGLAIFLGDQCDPKFYNGPLAGAGLLPCELLAPVGVEESGLAGQPMHLLEADTNHPTLARFGGSLRGALAGVDVYRVWEVTPHDAWVYAGLDGRRALLMERNFGRGKTMVCTTIPTPSWTNLPLRRMFVTWVGQTVSYLAGGPVGPADGQVGRDLALPGLDAGGDQSVRVRTPDGRWVDSSVRRAGGRSGPYLPGEMVTLAGFYAVPNPGAGADRSRDRVVAVNVARSESLPAVLDLDAAARGAGRWLVHRSAAAPDDARALLAGREGSVGLWDYLLWVVMILVLVEPLIANVLPGSHTNTGDGAGAGRKPAMALKNP